MSTEHSIERNEPTIARCHPWLTVSALATVALAAVPFEYGPVRTWPATHFLFRYGDGPRQRSLVGTLLGWALGDEPVTIAAVTAVSTVLMLAALATLVGFGFLILRRRQDLLGVVFVVAMLLSPGTIRFLTNDLGRFDVIGYLAVIAVMVACARSSTAVTVGVAAVAGVIGIAVHEAFAFMHFPLVLAVVVVKVLFEADTRADDASAKAKRVAPRLAGTCLATIAPALAVFIWIQAGPTLGQDAVAEHLAMVSERAAFDAESGSVRVLARSFSDNLSVVAGGIERWGPIDKLVIPLLLVVPSLIVAGLMLYSEHQRQRLHRSARRSIALLALAACGPLALFPIGDDWGRWLAMLTLNIFVATAWWTVVSKPSDPSDSQRAIDSASALEVDVSLGIRARIVLVAMAALSTMMPVPGLSGGISGMRLEEALSRLFGA